MPRRPSISTKHYAKIAEYNGVMRGKIPTPLVRMMSARPGDYMVFSIDKKGRVTVELLRAKDNPEGKTKI